MDAKFLNDLGSGLDVFGRMFGAFGSLEEGSQARAASEFQAAQFRQNANNAQGTAQREALTADQQAKMIASRALAVAASSGGGASDPTVVHLIAGIAGEGAYRQAVALYNGAEQARQLGMHADAALYEGRAAEQAATRRAVGGFVGAGTSAIKGIARGQSLFEKYGAGGPNLKPATGDSVNAWGFY